jgi:hypothetical protein
MRHRSPGRSPRRLSPSRRLTSAATVLSVLAAAGIATAIGTSLAGGSQNLIANPGFETDLTGWSPLSSPQHLDRVPGGHSGGYAAKLWGSAAGTVVLKDRPNTVTSTKAGHVFHVAAWVKTTTPNVDAVLRVREVSGKGSLVDQHGDQVRLKDDSWTQVSFDYKAAKDGDQLDFNVLARNLSVGHALLVDDVWLSDETPAVNPPAPSKTPSASPTPKPSPTQSAPAPTPTPSVTTPPPAPSPTPTPTTPSDPPVTNADGTLFGSSVYQETGETFQAAYDRRVREFGSMPVDRVFYPGLPKPWPGNAGYGNGRAVFVSFKMDPQQVLTGAYDATLTSWFQTAPRTKDVYWTYYHEPEDNIEAGAFTAAQYRAAWQRISGLALRANNPRLHSTLILMCYTLTKYSGRTFSDYYAGDAYIDVLGWDCYNQLWAKGQYVDPATQFSGVLDESAATGKPFAITEFGSQIAVGDTTGSGRAAWLRASAAFLSSVGAVAVTYFDSPVSNEYRLLDTNSLTAWASVVASS